MKLAKIGRLQDRRAGHTCRLMLILAGIFALTQAPGCMARRFDSRRDATVSRAVPSLQNAELLDANDVSILVPLSLVDQFPASAFLKNEQFQKAIANGQGQGPNNLSQLDFSIVKDLPNWKVVSMRYDPCAPGAHAAEAFSNQKEGDPGAEAPGRDLFCKAQVRLIIQPVINGGDLDFTMHLVYGLEKSEAALATQVQGLIAIKRASTAAGAPTTGRALSVHPGLSLPSNKNGPVVAAFKEFISKHCSADRLASIAVMGLANGGPEPWTFYANRVQDGVVIDGATPIPTVDTPSSTAARFQAVAFVGPQRVIGQPSQSVTFPFVTEEDLTAQPKLISLQRDPILLRSTSVIMNSTQVENAPNSRNKVFDDQSIVELDTKKLEILHSIDNPELNHFFSIDCVSCHTSANLMLRRHDVIVQTPSLAGQGELQRIVSGQPNRFVTPKGTTSYVSAAARQDQASFGRPWSLRNFGYFQGKPSVAFRTATETGEVLREIHGEMMRSNQLGPNACAAVPDSEWPAKDAALWKCIQFDMKDSEQCIAEICEGRPPAPGPNPSARLRAALDDLKTIGANSVMIHGEKGKFAANLVSISTEQRSPVLPPDARQDIKFDVRHSPTDKSNLALAIDDGGNRLTGFRYNMNFTDQIHRIELAWNPAEESWKGIFRFGNGKTEEVRIEPVRP